MPELNYDSLQGIAVDVVTKLSLVAVWLLGGWWLSRLASTWVRKALGRRSMGWNGTVLLSRLASLIVRAISVLLVLNTLGVSGTGLLAVVSAFTVAIGLSLQDVMKNFFAGIYLLLERPFRVGDRITVRDVTGEVQGIDIRTTLIKSQESELVLVPNATIFTEILRNDSHFGVRRLDITITSADRTVDQIEEAIQSAMVDVEGVRQPIPAPRIASRSGESLSMVLSLMVDDRDQVQNRVSMAVIEALPDDTIEVAAS